MATDRRGAAYDAWLREDDADRSDVAVDIVWHWPDDWPPEDGDGDE